MRWRTLSLGVGWLAIAPAALQGRDFENLPPEQQILVIDAGSLFEHLSQTISGWQAAE